MFRRLFCFIRKRISPIKYWTKKGLKIGKGCSLLPGCDFGTEPYLVEIGDHVRVNNNVRFITHDGGVWVVRKMFDELHDADMFGKIIVGNNVHIGTSATIMPGVTIGNNVIIGCGAIVTHNIPNNSVAVGVPARVIESIYDYKNKHDNDFLHTKQFKPKEKEIYLKKYFD